MVLKKKNKNGCDYEKNVKKIERYKILAEEWGMWKSQFDIQLKIVSKKWYGEKNEVKTFQ